jgi:phosphomannomutase
VQVTASHNPAQYNGFKISGIEARPVGAETGLTDIKNIAIGLKHTAISGKGAVEKFDLTPEYKKFILKFLEPRVKGLKIAVDASNGMAGKFVPLIYGDLPVEIIGLNFTHDGTFNHDPNPLVEDNLRQIKDKTRESGAVAGFCFDGDADRLMLVDENGRNVPADLMVALMVPYFLANEPKGTTVIYDLRSSRVVREEIEKFGGTPSRNRVGHVFMKKALRESQGVFGGELSGHFYYRDNFYADSGLVTFSHMLNIIHAAGKSVSEMVKPLRRYFQSGEINFKVEDKQSIMDELASEFKDGQIDHLDGVTVQFDDWWFNCRPSNTEPLLRLNVEANTKELLESKLEEIESVIGRPAYSH